MVPYRGLTLTSPPQVEPVAIADVKDVLGLSTTADDTMLTAFVLAAREACEKHTGRALITQTWRLSLDHLPGEQTQWWYGVREMPVSELYGQPKPMYVPRWPLQSVSSVVLYDWDDSATTVDSSIYYVDTAQEPGRVLLRYGKVWPQVTLRVANGVEIKFVAGYGDAATDVPQPLREGIKQMAAFMFEHRGECDAQTAVYRSGAATMWDLYKIGRV